MGHNLTHCEGKGRRYTDAYVAAFITRDRKKEFMDLIGWVM